MKPLFLLLLVLSIAACGTETPAPEGEAVARSSADAPAEAVAEMTEDVQVVHVTVGPGGYSPEQIELEAGVPARLVFTRSATSSCVEQVHVPEFGIERTDLPLNEEVAIEFTPEEAGTFTFLCGMDMLKGTIVVRS